MTFANALRWTRYCAPKALSWVRVFDVEFYRHVYRLNGWPFDPETTARPGIIGHWTNDLYDRLAPMIRPELHRRVKRNAKGKPTEKLTSYLTDEEGRPRLRELLEGVKALMRISPNWRDYLRLPTPATRRCFLSDRGALGLG
jgi:hypothetical protein